MSNDGYMLTFPILNDNSINIQFSITTLDGRKTEDEEVIGVVKSFISKYYNDNLPDSESFNNKFRTYPVSCLISYFDQIFHNLCTEVIFDEYIVNKLYIEVNGTSVLINHRDLVMYPENYEETINS